MKLLLLIAIFFGVVGCKKKQRDDTEPSPPLTFASVAERMLAMSDGGWVVSRDAEGQIKHEGDSLLWTSIAMGALDCEDAAKPESSLLAMLDTTGGKLWRHPSLPDEWSLDGAIGFYSGTLAHIKRCPEKRPIWSAALAAHAGTHPSLPPKFDVLLRAVQSELADNPNDRRNLMPSESERGELATECVGWAIATVSQKAAAYRLHLCWLTLSSIYAPKGKEAWCAAVEDAKMPLLEHFCGRPGLQAWVNAFRYDAWEYAHQRAYWEDPDGGGLKTPALDYLVALRALEGN